MGFELTWTLLGSRIYCITDIDPDHRKLSQLEAMIRFLTGEDPDLECECHPHRGSDLSSRALQFTRGRGQEVGEEAVLGPLPEHMNGPGGTEISHRKRHGQPHRRSNLDTVH